MTQTPLWLTQIKTLKIIDELKELTLKEDATFGIFHDREDSEESFIQANKEGLRLFALELLKATVSTDGTIPYSGKNVILIPSREKWIDKQSQTIIQCIELVDKKRDIQEEEQHPKTIADDLMPVGCIVAIIVIIISTIVGFITLLKWIF